MATDTDRIEKLITVGAPLIRVWAEGWAMPLENVANYSASN